MVASCMESSVSRLVFAAVLLDAGFFASLGTLCASRFVAFGFAAAAAAVVVAGRLVDVVLRCATAGRCLVGGLSPQCTP